MVPSIPGNYMTAVQFVVEVIGATPTVTWKAQGSVDGTNWYDLLYITNATNTPAATAIVATTVSAVIVWLDVSGGSRAYTQYRVVTSSNTNVTYRAELYAFEND